jgi:hypothetical protein
MSMEALVKRLGRALHQCAHEIETEDTHDHAEQQANFGAAKAIRTVADTIGIVLIDSEDFREDTSCPHRPVTHKIRTDPDTGEKSRFCPYCNRVVEGETV